MTVFMTLMLSSFLSVAFDWPVELQGQLTEAQCQSLSNHNKRLDVPVDGVSSAETFSLFYFTTKAFNPSLPTLLFIDGGPGQGPGTFANTLRFSDVPFMNVVYFHPRAYGCSTLPASNEYDQYIGTPFILKDIEWIRKDLGLQQWDLVWGTSYGSQVAVQYVKKTQGAVTEKVILEAWYLPEVDTGDPASLIFSKGLSNFLEIATTWPQYQTPEVQEVVTALSDQLGESFTGDFFTKSGVAFDQEQYSLFASQLQRLGYVGAMQLGLPLAGVSAYGPMFRLLELLNDGQSLDVGEAPILDVANEFPMDSRRSFFVTVIMETNGREAATLFEQVGSVWHPDLVPGANLLTTPDLSTLDTQFYVIQGDRDLATPLEAVESYLSRWPKIPENIEFFKLPFYGHSRHFSGKCYTAMFQEWLKEAPELSTGSLTSSRCLVDLGSE